MARSRAIDRTNKLSPPPMRPIFVGGCPRSGTTLRGALLGAHSRCVCVPESPFKFKLLLRMEWERGSPSSAEVGRVLYGHPKFRIWGIPADVWPYLAENERGRASGEGSSAYRSLMEGLVRCYAAEVGRPEADLWVDHTPWNLRFAATLLDRFPDAHVLHLVRDGRAVAASLLPLPFGPSTILDAAEHWAAWLAFGLAAEGRYPDRVHRVHFEELVAGPSRVLARLCERIGLEAEEGLGTRTEFRLPRYTRDAHALVGSPPDPSRGDAWRETLTEREVEVFEATTRDLLPLLGYRLRFGGRARRATQRERAISWARAAASVFLNRLRTAWRVWRWVPRPGSG